MSAVWGDNAAAQLGAGPGGPSHRATPSNVLRPSKRHFGAVQQTAAGGQATCGTVLSLPDVFCWGANGSGQSGQAPTSARLVPYASAIVW